ncbi:response regulator transcription factor [Paenibacillus sp. CAU 1782]
MISMLIVDDEQLLTLSLKADIEWENLGIGNVYTAYNSRQAKAIFESEQIDLMLCDIEMPQGSGLDLLAWVKEHYPRTEAVFMTCHAEFNYAKRAMQLGSFDYLLKPVLNDELYEVVGRALEKIRQDHERMEYSQIGHFWARHQPLVAERLWLDIIDQTIPSNPAAIKKEAEERNMPFSEHMRFLPVLLSVDRYHKPLSARDEKIMEYALTNSGEEMMGLQGVGLLFKLANRKLLALIPMEKDNSSLRDQMQQRCKAFIDFASRFFYCDLSIYIGMDIYSHELSKMVGQLLEWDKHNVALHKNVFMWEKRKPSGSEIVLPDMNVWSVLLKEGRGEQVIAEAEAFLAGLIGTENVDADSLYRFHQNLLQTLFYVLKLKGIEAQLLFHQSDSTERFQQAAYSVSSMIEWVKDTVRKAMESMGAIQHSPSMIQRAEQFIEQNIDAEKLTREDVANHLFLNADYLDRLLKKEAGCSATDLIIQKRMLLAQRLLEGTTLPVSTIAVQSGYSNLGHFSRRFKKFAGASPHEYRITYQSSKNR